MKSHELILKSTPDRKRVGRGIGSGTGKTSGRGTKGQNSRTGGGVRPGFEGGQNPLAKRLPKKRGFASLSRVVFQIVNLDQLSKLASGTYDIAQLKSEGIVNYTNRPVKLLGDGEIKKKIVLQIQAASASAKAKVEQAGGTIEIVELPRKRTKLTKD